MATIDELYQQLLGRAADTEGANYWQSQMDNGMTADQVAAAMKGSSEYQLDGNELAQIYRDNFGREADTSGSQYWLNKANTEGISAYQMADIIKNAAQADDRNAMADKAQYPSSWNTGLNADGPNLHYNAETDQWEQSTGAKPASMPAYSKNWQQEGMAGDYRSLNDADWEALQKSIYDASVAGLGRQEELARAASNQSMSNRGIWSSGIAERAQNDITGQLGAAYEQAGANAATQRYNLQNSDNQAYNQYNLSNQSLGNQYYLGRESNANTAQSIANQYALGQGQLALGNLTQNDSYALSRAGLLNDANAQASNAQWQAQWTPANFLSGVWNGTGGTVTSGSSGGGWNFMI